MKNLAKFLLMVLLVLSMNSLFAQDEEPSMPKHAFTYKFLQIDHFTPATDNTADFFDDFTSGAEIGYNYNFNNRWTLGIPLKIGIGNYPINANANPATFTSDRLFFSADATGIFRIFKYDKTWFNPYLMAGIGIANNDSDWHSQAPVGGGINWRLAKNFYLQTQGEFRFALGDKGDDNNQLGIGILVLLGGSEPEPPKELPPVDSDGDGIADKDDDCPQEPGLAQFKGCPDKDEDGIADKDDECPDIAGSAEFNGCPDTDGDGLADSKDKCPNEAGPIENEGCPVADRDGDGVADKDDDCPDEAGSAILKGCPDKDNDGVADKDDNCPDTPGTKKLKGCPDRDNDGVTDAADKCPDRAGPASNKGCPEMKEDEKIVIELETKAIQFETNSATIKKSSHGVLDKVAEILNKYPEYNVNIDGHTDSVGAAAYNQKLSERRAKSCLNYLISKGVTASRMKSQGFGEDKPIADNINKAGRKQNRRVEFNLYLR